MVVTTIVNGSQISSLDGVISTLWGRDQGEVDVRKSILKNIVNEDILSGDRRTRDRPKVINDQMNQ